MGEAFLDESGQTFHATAGEIQQALAKAELCFEQALALSGKPVLGKVPAPIEMAGWFRSSKTKVDKNSSENSPKKPSQKRGSHQQLISSTTRTKPRTSGTVSLFVLVGYEVFWPSSMRITWVFTVAFARTAAKEDSTSSKQIKAGKGSLSRTKIGRRSAASRSVEGATHVVNRVHRQAATLPQQKLLNPSSRKAAGVIKPARAKKPQSTDVVTVRR